MITNSATTSSAVTVRLIHTSATRLAAARQTKTIPSLISCSSASIKPYILLTSDVMLLWITAVSALR